MHKNLIKNFFVLVPVLVFTCQHYLPTSASLVNLLPAQQNLEGDSFQKTETTQDEILVQCIYEGLRDYGD